MNETPCLVKRRKRCYIAKKDRRTEYFLMEMFCTDGEWNRALAREKRHAAACRTLAALTPAVFITLCLLVRTRNARVMHPVMLAATAVLGGAALAWYTLLLRPARQERKHLEMLRGGEKEILEGVLRVTGTSLRIPKSVRVRRVFLDTGEERPALLNVDERWVSRMPPDGTRVRAAAVHGYIAGVDAAAGPQQDAGTRRPSRIRAFFRGAADVVPLLILWGFFTLIFGSFVFYRITDTVPARKITVFMDGVTVREDQLAAEMEERMGEPIRMVQVHPFSYMMFGTEDLKSADLFIVPDCRRAEYADWFAPGEDCPVMFDPADGTAVAGEYFLYGRDGAEGPYRLYIGAESPHLADGLAREAARVLYTIDATEEEKP